MFRIAAELNNVPLASGDASTLDHPFNILTPNRLLTGRNHDRFTHFQSTMPSTSPSQYVQRAEDIMSSFMTTLSNSIMRINSKSSKKWASSSTKPCVGDIVLMLKDSDNAKTSWSIARIVTLSSDFRKVDLLVPKPGGVGAPSILTRSLRDCILITKVDSPLRTKVIPKQLRLFKDALICGC